MVYSVRAHFHVSVVANYFCSLDEQCPFVTKVALLQPFGVGMGQDLTWLVRNTEVTHLPPIPLGTFTEKSTTQVSEVTWRLDCSLVTCV